MGKIRKEEKGPRKNNKVQTSINTTQPNSDARTNEIDHLALLGSLSQSLVFRMVHGLPCGVCTLQVGLFYMYLMSGQPETVPISQDFLLETVCKEKVTP